MNWPVVSLGEAVSFKGGGTPSRNVEKYWNGSIPWATVKDLNSGYSLALTQEFITDAGLQNSASNLIPSGTVIIPTRMALGKAVIAAVDVAINQDLKAVFSIEELDARFLLWYFIANRARIVAMGKGATVKGITLDQLRALQIPLPPLPEQHRIATLLDKADTLRSQRRAAVAKLDELLHSVFIDMFGDPVTNPKGWEVSSISATKSKVQIGPFGSLLHKEDYITGGVALINPMHIVAGKITPGVEQTVSPEKAIELSLYRMRAGDIVIGRRGEMGRCAVVTSAEEGMLCGTGSLFIRPDGSRFTSRYLMFALSSNSMKLYLESLSQGVTMANLNSSMVENLRIPVPPLTEQQRFTSIAEKIKKQKQQMHNSAKQLEALFASLQQRAFSGTL